MAMEKDQCHLARLVMNIDAVGHAPVAARWCLVAVDADFQRDDHAFRRAGNAWLAAAVDYRMGQVEDQVAQNGGACLFAAAQQPRHRLFDLRADPFQARNRCKQRIEDVGAHGSLCGRRLGGLQL